MKIAILDVVPSVYWASDEGRTDGSKFKTMLESTGIDAELTVHYLPEGDWPDRATDYDAFLLSGSPCSAMEQYDWTDGLTNLINQIIERRSRLVGVCFGHQFIARHLDGEVVRAESGWMIGRYPAQVIDHQLWMSPEHHDGHIYYFNQDQVSRLPEGATHIATAPTCEYAAWCMDDRIFCVQGHPEQPIDSMQNFIRSTRDSIDHGVLDAAEKSMEDKSVNADVWARWIASFLLL